ncbi:DnaB-like helicase N-terminal domain-containing protein [Corynebacterium mayonis]|uniref:DnaB-like helicase N-terminal domain-containing protein n=1 Tax=Corynebacterium mayonis TaxID=3062461 RepID=UPI0031404B5D
MTRPDFNSDPEVQVLNELLWSPNEPAVAFVLDTLREKDFYNPLYGQVFTAIKDNHTRGHGRDAVSVNTHLLNNHDELGIGNPQVVSHLLVNIAVLETPHHNLRDNAHAVLVNSYRRGFDAVADSLKFASQEAPTEQLFGILVDHGKQQRAATERLAGFAATYDAAAGASPRARHTAPEESTPLERLQAQLHTRGSSQRDVSSTTNISSQDHGLEM